MNPKGAGTKPKYPTVQCPKCGQQVGATYIKRHTDNCSGEE